MLEGKKLFIAVDQYFYDYDGDGDAEVSRVFLGPNDAHPSVLKQEWQQTWRGRPYTRKGVTKTGKTLHPVISFFDWLVKERGFVPLDYKQWQTL